MDRGKQRSKRRLLTCESGDPLASQTTAGNVNDITQLIRSVDAVPPVRGRRGRWKRRPVRVYGDRAYHSGEVRRQLRARRIKTRVAWPEHPHGSGLGRCRWVVERIISRLPHCRRLTVRYEQRADIHEALLTIGYCLICFNQLQTAHSF